VTKVPSLTNEQEKELEAYNGLRQYDMAMDATEMYLDRDHPFALRPSLLLQLQAEAVKGIELYPGQWRVGTAKITHSDHNPPGPHLVENLVTEMCDYVNDNFHEFTAFYLASFIMWRLNWIHPFSDGNGRTSRILSYLVLNVKLGYVLPGMPNIPIQIEANRDPYYNALKAADKIYVEEHRFDLTKMETMLRGMLARQLLSVIETADGEAD